MWPFQYIIIFKRYISHSSFHEIVEKNKETLFFEITIDEPTL